MRLPILVLAHIVTAHRVDLDLTETTGEGSDTSSIAATALQDSTAVVGTHGSDSGVLSQADLGIPGKLMQRLALILAASSVLGGPQWAVEAKAVPTAFVAPGVRRNALSGSGFRPSAIEAAGPGSGIPDPSGQGSFMNVVKKRIADDFLAQPLKALDQIGAGEKKIEWTPRTMMDKASQEALDNFLLNGNVVPRTTIERAEFLFEWLKGQRSLFRGGSRAETRATALTKDQKAEFQSYRKALDDFVLTDVDAVPRTMMEEADIFVKLYKEAWRLAKEPGEMESALGMTKDQEAEYQSDREALDDFLINNVDAVPLTVSEEADVLLRLRNEARRLFIERRDAEEAPAVANIDSDPTTADPTQDTSFSVAEAPIEAAVVPSEAAPIEAAPLDSDPTKANPIQDSSISVADAAPIEAAVVPSEAAPSEAAPIEAASIEATPIEADRTEANRREMIQRRESIEATPIEADRTEANRREMIQRRESGEQ